MKSLEPSYRKNYCENCHSIDEFESCKARYPLSQENLNKITHFDKKPENNIRIVIHNGVILLINCQVFLKDRGALSGININVYDLQKYRTEFPDSSPVGQVRSIYEWDELLNSLWIEDCEISVDTQRNKGYGSIMMMQFLVCAKFLGVAIIKGRFSLEDDWNANRREHFYRKHGFSILGRNIELILNK